MSGELDEKARDLALTAWFDNTSQGWPAAMDAAIRAYIAASPSPSMEMEVVAFDGVAKRKLDGLLERGWKVSGYALHQDGEHGLVTTGGFVGWFSVAERNDADARAKLATAEAQVLRLTEENEALRKERTSLIETKREQIERLELSRGAASQVALDAITRAEAAEARIKALEEALSHALDHYDRCVSACKIDPVMGVIGI